MLTIEYGSKGGIKITKKNSSITECKLSDTAVFFVSWIFGITQEAFASAALLQDSS